MNQNIYTVELYPTATFFLTVASRPNNPVPNSHIAAGTGIPLIEPEKLVDVVLVAVSNRSVSDCGLVN